MKVMGVMTDEGLDSACARVRMHLVSVQCSAPSASVHPVRKPSCIHCSSFLMPGTYLYLSTMYNAHLNNIEIRTETEVHPVAIHSIICISFCPLPPHWGWLVLYISPVSTFQLGDGWIHIQILVKSLPIQCQ